MGHGRERPLEGSPTLEQVRQELASETADSDAAVILSRAIAKAGMATPQRRATVLGKARKQAKQAKRFRK